MITFLFVFLLLALMCGMIKLAFKAAWGITKITFGLIFLPLALVLLVLVGLIYLAFPILIIVGILCGIKALVK